MDVIIIIFVIITIISSVVKAASKSAKGSAPPRPSFPPLSVDTPRPAQRAAEPVKDTGTVAAPNAPYGLDYETEASLEGDAYDVGAPNTRASLEMGNAVPAADTSVKSTDISKYIRPVNVDLSELKVDLVDKDAPAPVQTAAAFDKAALFKDRSEVVKAVIYAEILRPRFRSR